MFIIRNINTRHITHTVLLNHTTEAVHMDKSITKVTSLEDHHPGMIALRHRHRRDGSKKVDGKVNRLHRLHRLSEDHLRDLQVITMEVQARNRDTSKDTSKGIRVVKVVVGVTIKR